MVLLLASAYAFGQTAQQVQPQPQHGSFATCWPKAVGDTCDSTIFWRDPFPDLNYTVSCTPDELQILSPVATRNDGKRSTVITVKRLRDGMPALVPCVATWSSTKQ